MGHFEARIAFSEHFWGLEVLGIKPTSARVNLNSQLGMGYHDTLTGIA